MKRFMLWLVSFAMLTGSGLAQSSSKAGVHDSSLVGATAFLPELPPGPSLTVSTVPVNGDVNPYGVAFAPSNFASGGILQPGDALVSSFNNGTTNFQGTGRTVVRITKSGQQSLFWQGTTGVGPSAAIGILSKGATLVGNVPTRDGTCKTIAAGGLYVLDKNGHATQYLGATQYLMDGPWGMTIYDQGTQAKVFVANVENGTVTRLDLAVSAEGVTVQHAYVIASGYTFYCNPTALIIGPTGLAYDSAKDVLYVASTGNNAIYAISNAGSTTTNAHRGIPAFSDKLHLHGPLGLLLVPNGNLVMSEGDVVNPDPNHPSELTEITLLGKIWHFVDQYQIDTTAGAAFGIALDVAGNRFAAVNDANNMLYFYNLR